MTDVVEIARDFRANLAAEMAKLDDFIRLAEALVKYSQGLERGPAMKAQYVAPKARLADRSHGARIISEDVRPRDGGLVESIKETIPVEAGVPSAFSQIDEASNIAGMQLVDILKIDSDHFAFNDETSENVGGMALIDPPPDSADSVDVSVGQRIRQRRWMLGISQQQLADNVGVKLEQIQKYEAGELHVSPGRMGDVAAAMGVPMTHFYEGIEGQAPGVGEARGEVLTEKEARALAHGAQGARTVKASGY